MTSIQIIFHEKLKAIQCFCGFIGRNHQCEKKLEKLLFAIVLKNIVVSAKIKLRETNIMKKDGLQTEMVTLFVGLVMKKYLMKFVLIVFVESVMCLWKNIVVVKERANFFLLLLFSFVENEVSAL